MAEDRRKDKKKKKREPLFRGRPLKDIRQDERGAFTYQGDMHCAKADEAGAAAWARICLMVDAAAFLCLLIIGFLPKSGLDGHVYLLLPYAGAFCLDCLTLWRLVRAALSKGHIRAYEFDRIIGRFPGYAGVSAVLGALICVGALVLLIIGAYDGGAATGAIVVALLAAHTVLAFYLIRRFRAMEWVLEKGAGTGIEAGKRQ